MMKTVFGLPLYENLSDEEFVEKCRKLQLGYSQCRGLVVLLGILTALLGGEILYFAYKLATANPPNHLWGVLYLGILIGVCFGGLFKHMSELVVRGLNHGSRARAERLMLQYYDDLIQQRKSI